MFKKSWLVIVLASVLLIPIPGRTKSAVVVEFFYGNGCPHCEKVKPVIADLETRYPAVEFKKYEVYSSQDNVRLLLQRYAEYGVPNEGGVPAVFIGSQMMLGDTPIMDNLENVIVAELAKVQQPAPVTEPRSESVPSTLAPVPAPAETAQHAASGQLAAQPAYAARPYSLAAITGAAVVDSINPCAIAVLLILLTALMLGAGDRWRALWGGLAFTLSIYVTYFLFGLGLLQLISLSHAGGWLYKVIGVVAILVGLANVKDFFFYGGGGFAMEIPQSWRPALKKLLSGVTTPLGAFLVGFVVTCFEFPCTGGPYFFVLGLLAQAQTITGILPVLLYYNLVFVLPLLLIVAIVYFGLSSVQRAEVWKEKHIKLLHLIAGLIMLALGVWVFWS